MKLSVILPVAGYNTRWIAEALESAQPVADEIIVSTDTSARVSPNDWPTAGRTVHLLTVDSPSGPEPAINAGIAVATGTHFSLLCSDDFYLPDFIMVKHLAETAQTDVTYGSVVFSGLLAGRWPKNELLTELEFQNCIPAGAIVRREWWYRAGGFRDVRYSDWDFWKRLKKTTGPDGKRPEFAFVPVDFYHYRAWEGTIGARYGYRSDLGHDWTPQMPQDDLPHPTPSRCD